MTSLVDFSRIKETSDGDVEFEQELIGMYLEDAEGHVADIMRNSGSGDLAAVKSTAHTLKGASANIGAVGMQEAALAVEKAANAGDHALLQDQVVQIQQVFTSTNEEFNDYLKTL